MTEHPLVDGRVPHPPLHDYFAMEPARAVVVAAIQLKETYEALQRWDGYPNPHFLQDHLMALVEVQQYLLVTVMGQQQEIDLLQVVLGKRARHHQRNDEDDNKKMRAEKGGQER